MDPTSELKVGFQPTGFVRAECHGNLAVPCNFKNPRAVLDDGCSALITFHENRKSNRVQCTGGSHITKDCAHGMLTVTPTKIARNFYLH